MLCGDVLCLEFVVDVVYDVYYEEYYEDYCEDYHCCSIFVRCQKCIQKPITLTWNRSSSVKNQMSAMLTKLSMPIVQSVASIQNGIFIRNPFSPLLLSIRLMFDKMVMFCSYSLNI